MALPNSENIASSSAQMLQNALTTTEAAREASQSAKVDIAVKADEATAVTEGQKRLNPLEFAKAMKARAAKKADEAAAAVNPAHDVVEAKVKEVRVATVDLRKAQIALLNAKDKLEDAERRLGRVSGDEAVNAATAAKTETEAKIKEGEAAVAAAQSAKAEKEQDVATAVRAYKDVDNARKAAADAVKSWNRRLAPVSVFISRKTQRLYVRQGYIKVFDVPVTIRDPEKPLGTHLFMAMQPAPESADGSPALRWLVLTVPESSADATDETRRKHRHRYDDDDDAPRVAPPTTSASEALDRIEVPAEVEGKISEMLWAGGSLIVSDSGISRETGDGTDFIILTR
jgi:hypothetical protein